MMCMEASALADLVQPMSNILALDQSSRITGWAVFQDDKLIDFNKFNAETAVGPDLPKRLQFIKNKVQELVNKYEIDEVVLEDIQMQSNVANNVQTFKTLAEVIGVISEYLQEENLPQTIVLASSWKSDLGIKGRDRAAQKRAAQQYVVDTYAQKPTQDECDAICIGLSYIKNTKSAF